MEEILHQFIGSFSHWIFTRFYTSQLVKDLFINSRLRFRWVFVNQRAQVLDGGEDVSFCQPILKKTTQMQVKLDHFFFPIFLGIIHFFQTHLWNHLFLWFVRRSASQLPLASGCFDWCPSFNRWIVLMIPEVLPVVRFHTFRWNLMHWN